MTKSGIQESGVCFTLNSETKFSAETLDLYLEFIKLKLKKYIYIPKLFQTYLKCPHLHCLHFKCSWSLVAIVLARADLDLLSFLSPNFSNAANGLAATEYLEDIYESFTYHLHL